MAGAIDMPAAPVRWPGHTRCAPSAHCTLSDAPLLATVHEHNCITGGVAGCIGVGTGYVLRCETSLLVFAKD